MSGAERAAGLTLTVTQGADRGAKLALTSAPRVLGRSREVDLPLTDVAISRRHLEAWIEGDRARLRVLSGARPIVIAGAEHADASLASGTSFVLGNTVIAVSNAREADIGATEVRTVLGGLAADVLGLGVILALTEALDAATSREGTQAAVAAFAARAGAVEMRLVFSGEGDLEPSLQRLVGDASKILEAPRDGGLSVVVPVASSRPGWLVVRVARSTLAPELRALFAVAARVCASSLDRLERLEQVEDDNASLRALAVGSARAFLGESAAAQQVAKLVPKLAASNAMVLLTGESGTGKTFVARLLHEAGPRASRPLRVINCAAIPEHLVESELFGHERGAFTGAVAQRAGVFEAAAGGTVLLDEIGELPLASQAKLLRVLEDRSFERIGSNRTLPLEARVLAATNRDLRAMIEAGRFREDLFFRISVVSLRLPSLRERGADLRLLAQQILRDLAPSAGRRVTGFSPDALRALEAYPWPGNVRELRNAIEHALVIGDAEVIAPSDLPELLRGFVGKPITLDQDTVRLPASLAELETRAIEAALRATGGNRTQAAALLGINRVTLYKKLKEEG